MSKEKTPITADKYFDNINWNMLLNECENPLDELKKRANLYAQAKVLEALEPIEEKLKKGLEYYERQVNKALERGEVDNVEGRSAVICRQFLKQIETEVKPKYK